MDQNEKIFHLTEEKRQLEHQIQQLKTSVEKLLNKNHDKIPPNLRKIKSDHQAENRQLEQKLTN